MNAENRMWKCPECGIIQHGKTCIRCGMTNIRARIGELLLPKPLENQAIFEDALCEDWDALQARAEKAEAMVERLIDAGQKVHFISEQIAPVNVEPLRKWRALVAEWRVGGKR